MRHNGATGFPGVGKTRDRGIVSDPSLVAPVGSSMRLDPIACSI